MLKCLSSMSALILLPLAAVADEIAIPVPSDPSAKYFLLNLQSQSGETLQVETRREGKSGISHSIRLVSCSDRTYGYVYDDDPRSPVFPIENPSTDMSPLSDQSISWWVSAFACKKLGLSSGW